VGDAAGIVEGSGRFSLGAFIAFQVFAMRDSLDEPVRFRYRFCFA
jgi:hypothetical protein